MTASATTPPRRSASGALAGYSGTPLARKLGVAEGTRLLVLGAPRGYRDWLAPLPAGVVFARRLGPAVDLVHLFETEKKELARRLRDLRSRIRPDAPIWVSWPKRASGVATTVTEDGVREAALPLGLVDVKVCAVTEVWSGLKLTIRKELR